MITIRGAKKTYRIDTIRTIEWIISTCTLFGGVYLFTPLYDPSLTAHTSSLVQVFAHPGMIFFWGAVLLVGALMVIIGLLIRQPQFKSAGWFAIIMARTFQIISTFMVAGFAPITWIYPLTITLVVCFLWTLARIEVNDAT